MSKYICENMNILKEVEVLATSLTQNERSFFLIFVALSSGDNEPSVETGIYPIKTFFR